MADILQFKQRNEPPPEDIALVCMCGCDKFYLLGNGQMECSACNFVVPGAWEFDSNDE